MVPGQLRAGVRFSILLVSLALHASAALAGADGPPAVVGCHQAIGPGGTIVLGSDLVCGPAPDQDTALVVLGPVTLDLGGHTIECVGGLRIGILVGSRAKIQNGTVKGCTEGIATDGSRSTLERLTMAGNDVGILIAGGTRNTLTAILVDGNRLGLRLTDGSDGNTVSDSTASNNSDVGFLIDDGQRNVLRSSRAIGNGRGIVVASGESRTQLVDNVSEHNAGTGISLETTSSTVLDGNQVASNGGDGVRIQDSRRTQVLDNQALGNLGNGFFVTASADGSEDVNLLQRNTAIGNGMNGIAIDATSTHDRVTGNTSTGHTAPFVDLLDMNGNCRRPVNTWKSNTFTTSSPDCLR